MTQIAEEVRKFAHEMTLTINTNIDIGHERGDMFLLNEDAVAEFLQQVYDAGYRAAEAKQEYS